MSIFWLLNILHFYMNVFHFRDYTSSSSVVGYYVETMTRKNTFIQ